MLIRITDAQEKFLKEQKEVSGVPVLQIVRQAISDYQKKQQRKTKKGE